MTPEAQRIAIAQALGIKPRRMWCFWYDKANRHGEIYLRDRAFAEIVRAERIQNWNAEAFGPCPNITQPEEYDDWRDAPNYTGDLNAMHEAEKILQVPVGNCLCGTWWNYRSNLIDICERDSGEQGCEHLNATAAQRAEAFLRTLNLYTT